MGAPPLKLIWPGDEKAEGMWKGALTALESIPSHHSRPGRYVLVLMTGLQWKFHTHFFMKVFSCKHFYIPYMGFAFPYEHLLLTPFPVCPFLSMVLINQVLSHLYPVLYFYGHYLPHIYEVL